MEIKRTVCFDFDGVIHSYSSRWKGADVIPDPPVEGALDLLKELTGPKWNKKYEVHIYSSRSHQSGGIKAMKIWLKQWYEKLYPAMAPETVLNYIEWPMVKPPAFITIDDRAINFTGSFKGMIDIIENFQPWNKRGI